MKRSLLVLALLASCKRHHAPAPSGTPEWSRDPLPNPAAEIFAIDGASATDVWAVGVGIYHYDGKAWSDTTPPGLRSAMNAVSVVAPNDVWVVGVAGNVAHFDGASWHVEQIATMSGSLGHYDLIDVLARPEGVWVTDAGKTIHQWDGKAWTTAPAPRAVQQLWGTSLRDVWLPGGNAMHWDGASWTTTRVPDVGLGWVRGSAPNDVWMVGWEGGSPKGANGAAAHFDGSTWSRSALPDGTPTLAAISVPRRDEAYAVGHDGWAIVWNGTSWRGSPTGVTQPLRTVYSPGGGVAFAAGYKTGPFVLHKK